MPNLSLTFGGKLPFTTHILQILGRFIHALDTQNFSNVTLLEYKNRDSRQLNELCY